MNHPTPHTQAAEGPNGAETVDVAELEAELKTVQDLADRFRREMGDGFFLTIQNAAHAERLRQQLAGIRNGRRLEDDEDAAYAAIGTSLDSVYG